MLNKEIDIQCAFMDVAIMRQMYYCKTKKCYYAGILVADKCDLLYDRLDNLITDCGIEDEIDRKARDRSTYEILFKNGSSITILKATEYIRGFRFHDMIIDVDIEIKLKQRCCYPIQVSYYSLNYDDLMRSRCVELKIPKGTPLSCFRYDMWK